MPQVENRAWSEASILEQAVARLPGLRSPTDTRRYCAVGQILRGRADYRRTESHFEAARQYNGVPGRATTNRKDLGNDLASIPPECWRCPVTALVPASRSPPPVLLGSVTPEDRKRVEDFFFSVASIFEAWVNRRKSEHTRRAYRVDHRADLLAAAESRAQAPLPPTRRGSERSCRADRRSRACAGNRYFFPTSYRNR